MADYALAKTGKLKLKGEKEKRLVIFLCRFIFSIYIISINLIILQQKEEEEAQDARRR